MSGDEADFLKIVKLFGNTPLPKKPKPYRHFRRGRNKGGPLFPFYKPDRGGPMIAAFFKIITDKPIYRQNQRRVFVRITRLQEQYVITVLPEYAPTRLSLLITETDQAVFVTQWEEDATKRYGKIPAGNKFFEDARRNAKSFSSTGDVAGQATRMADFVLQAIGLFVKYGEVE
jgi:hypothetical protein